MKSIERRNILIKAIKNITQTMKTKIEDLKKGQENLNRDDFIWHFLLQSLSGMGNNWGYYGLIENKDNYNRVRFDVISKLLPEKRLKHLKKVLYEAKVRMSEKKAMWLEKNYDLIVKNGGLIRIKEEALNQKGKKAKINFLMKFHGIGKESGRNIWMDVYHPDFHDSVIINYRIEKITQLMGWNFNNNEEHEKFYLDIAKEAGIQGWELDRLLFHYNKYFIEAITLKNNEEHEKTSCEPNKYNNRKSNSGNNINTLGEELVSLHANHEELFDPSKQNEKIILNKNIFPDYMPNSKIIGKKILFSPKSDKTNYKIYLITEEPNFSISLAEEPIIQELNYDTYAGKVGEIYKIYDGHAEYTKIVILQFTETNTTIYIHIPAYLNSHSNQIGLDQHILLEEYLNAIAEYKDKILTIRYNNFGRLKKYHQSKEYFNPKIFDDYRLTQAKIIDIEPIDSELRFYFVTSKGLKFNFRVNMSRNFKHAFPNNLFQKLFYIDEVVINKKNLIMAMKIYHERIKFNRYIITTKKWYECYFTKGSTDFRFKMRIKNAFFVNNDEEKKIYFDEELLTNSSVYQIDFTLINFNKKNVKLRSIIEHFIITDHESFEFQPLKMTPPKDNKLYCYKKWTYDLIPKIPIYVTVFFALPREVNLLSSDPLDFHIDKNPTMQYLLKIKNGYMLYTNTSLE